jgi:catechol 2,3-dioxygenase-like lactoylglutathione lyase family enzyme
VTSLYARSVFFVAEADRSQRFYTEDLGFTLDWDSHDGVFQVSLFGFELILNQVGDRTRSRAGHGRVFIGLDDDQGEPPIALTSDSADAFMPRWSPGDSELTFHAYAYGSRDIFTVRADEEGRTRVTSDPGQEYYPDWSPDGKRIVFNSPVTRRPGRDVFVVTREGSAWSVPRRVSDPADRGIGQFVRWSPDGKSLAIIHGRGASLLPAQLPTATRCPS